MKIIAGIDEAGYAPTFGPLVLSVSIFRIKKDAEEDMWKILSNCVTKKPERNSDKLVINDSKKVYCGKLANLERSVLPFLRCCNSSPDCLWRMLKEFSLNENCSFDGIPWYKDLDVQLPASSEPKSIDRYYQCLQEGMACSGVQFLAIKTFPVEVPQLNRDFDRNNKSVALFEYTFALLNYLRETYGNEEMQVTIDKHGGRMRYGGLLSGAFWQEKLKILCQNRYESSYEISGASGKLKISFKEKAEDKSFPVALSSMVSKYVRELFMILFNRFWQGLCEDIKPTSGYPQDARRFLKLIEPLIIKHGIDKDMLVRNR